MLETEKGHNSIELKVSINDLLHEDLVRHAAESETTLQAYIAEIVEAYLATRRLRERHSIMPEEAQPTISPIYSLGA